MKRSWQFSFFLDFFIFGFKDVSFSLKKVILTLMILLFVFTLI